MFDVVIIGAGVTGCAIARALSAFSYKTAVVDKESDVCEGTSKANSGIVHAGYDAKPGTLKAQLNLRGNRLMKQLSEELDFSFKENGSLVICFDEEDKLGLQALYERGLQNGVEGLRIIAAEELRQLEPGISLQAVSALYAPTGGIVCPFGLTIALAENAYENGTDFLLETEVQCIEKNGETYKLHTSRGIYESRIVINAAGVYADTIHNMVSSSKLHIIPRRGEYCLFDKAVGNRITHTVFSLPTKYGKGVLVTPTVHGNLLMGPTAEDIEDKEGIDTTQTGLEDVLTKGRKSIRESERAAVITSFAGLRAHEIGGDFVIAESEDAPGFIDAAGIESPGLTCAPAIAEYVAEIVQSILPAEKKEGFRPTRKGISCMAEAAEEEKIEMIQKNPAYANVICRCELVTEGEIMDAIHRPLGAVTLDGIKRRTRAGMGRCQAGFCTPKTMEILARELGKDIDGITKSGGDSIMLAGYNKE